MSRASSLGLLLLGYVALYRNAECEPVMASVVHVGKSTMHALTTMVSLTSLLKHHSTSHILSTS